MIDINLRRRFITGLLLVLVGLGSFLFAQLYANSLESMFPFRAAEWGLIAWIVGASIAASAAGQSSMKRYFVAAAALATLALVQYHILQFLFGSEEPSSVALWIGKILSFIPPIALITASMTSLGLAMVALADNWGLTYGRTGALRFVFALGVLTVLELYASFVNGGGSEDLILRLEWMRWAILILGTIQLFFLVLLVREAIRRR